MIFNNKYSFNLFDFPTLLPRLAKLSQYAMLLFLNLVQLFSVTQNNLNLKNISSWTKLLFGTSNLLLT